MFDARSILDNLVGGGPPQGRGRQPETGTFRDPLGQLGEQGAARGAPPRPMPGPPTEPGDQAGPGGASLPDILRELLQGGPGGAPWTELSRALGEGAQAQGGDAGLLDALKQLLGQATDGVREGASRIDQETGAMDAAREALGQATGQTPEELVARIRDVVARNPLATGAALGGLGALVLGTRTGQSLAANAATLGGIALIGGLAYKAYRNYQQGEPVLPSGRPGEPEALATAPEGSGFEAGAVSDEVARCCIRAMIAAAGADGRIDAAEQQKVLAGLRQAGMEQRAQQFLAAEITNPATPAELAAGVGSPQEALQVYTAARVAVDVDAGAEHAFLSSLARALGIDETLAGQVDAAARDTA